MIDYVIPFRSILAHEGHKTATYLLTYLLPFSISFLLTSTCCVALHESYYFVTMPDANGHW